MPAGEASAQHPEMIDQHGRLVRPEIETTLPDPEDQFVQRVRADLHEATFVSGRLDLRDRGRKPRRDLRGRRGHGDPRLVTVGTRRDAPGGVCRDVGFGQLAWGEPGAGRYPRSDPVRPVGAPVVPVDIPCHQVQGAPPKTAKSRRTVPVGKVFVDRVAAHLKEFPALEVTIMDKTGREPVERTARLVVTTGAGLPLRRNRFSESVWLPLAARLAQLCDAAHKQGATRPCGFCVFAGPERPTSICHFDLRHFYASALIAGGASVTQVQHRLGHSTAQETLNAYSHLWPDEDDRTRDVIDALFIPAPRDSGRVGARLAVVP